MAGLLFRKTFLDVVIVNEEVKKRSKSAPAAMSLGNLLKLLVLRLIELVSILKCVFFVFKHVPHWRPPPILSMLRDLAKQEAGAISANFSISIARKICRELRICREVWSNGDRDSAQMFHSQKYGLKISASQMLTPRAIYSLLVPSEVANLEKRSELLKSNPDAEKVHITHSSMPTSKGSVGHPEVCRRPCIQFLRGHCDRGALCGYCHLTHVPRL